MRVRTLFPFTDKNTGKIMRTGDIFECAEDRFAEIENAGHYVEAIPDDIQGKDPIGSDYLRFDAMTGDELRIYADRHFKLTFHENVERAEMIAAIIAREKGY